MQGYAPLKSVIGSCAFKEMNRESFSVNEHDPESLVDPNTSPQTFPCFMRCNGGDPSTDSSYVNARLKIGPHEMIVDFHTECFALFNEWRLGSGTRYAQYELLFQKMINRVPYASSGC